jgi:hypothetical protein
MPMTWRRLTIATHRDLGYTLVALVIVYGISGVAVNHIEDWNPNYRRTTEHRSIEPLAGLPREEQTARAVVLLGIDSADVKNSFRPEPETLQLFVGTATYHVDLPTGKVLVEAAIPRPVLYEFNQLHLNTVKGTWTYVADAFAVAMILLALTGLFIVKGDNGPLDRGKWFVLGGVILPLAFWLSSIAW